MTSGNLEAQMDGSVQSSPSARLTIDIQHAGELSDRIWGFGDHVPPRGGKVPRTADQKEDWTIRRMLVALARAGRVAFPSRLVACDQRAQGEGWPDYVLFQAGKTPLGFEVTEAGEQSFQVELSRDAAGPSGLRFVYDADGMVGDLPERLFVKDIIDAVERKVKRVRQRPYRTSDCDLVVYANSRYGISSARQDLHRIVRQFSANVLQVFHAVHVVSDNRVHLGLWGDAPSAIDLGRDYDIDFNMWALAQAAALREGRFADLDRGHLAEEIEALSRSDNRALRSHLVNLYLHWLKWEHQPNRRSASWANSIDNSLTAVLELIEESPSLDPRPDGTRTRGVALDRVYDAARARAARETRLPPESFPSSPPYDYDQLLAMEPPAPPAASRR